MSSTKRRGRAAEVIKDTLSLSLSQAADPRLNTINVTDVEVNQDMSAAKVWYFVGGDDPQTRADALAGLKHAQGFLRTQIAEALDLRRAPTLTFHYDESVGRASRVLEILDKLETDTVDGGSDGDNPADA